MTPELGGIIRALADKNSIFRPKDDPDSIGLRIRTSREKPMGLVTDKEINPIAQCMQPMLEKLPFEDLASVPGNGDELAWALAYTLPQARRCEWITFSKGDDDHPIGSLLTHGGMVQGRRVLLVDLLAGYGTHLLPLAIAVRDMGHTVTDAVVFAERVRKADAGQKLLEQGVTLHTLTNVDEIDAFCRVQKLDIPIQDA